MKNLVIGLDISTKTCGFSSILIEDNKIIEANYSYYKPNKKDNDIKMIYDTKVFIIDKIDEFAQEYNADPIVYIEDIIMSMTFTTARTITILSAINRTLCVAAYEKYNGNVNLLPVASWRAILRKSAELSGRLEKEKVPEAIEKIMRQYDKNWKFDYELQKRGKNKGKQIIENLDKADSLGIAIAGAYKQKLLIETPVEKKKLEKKHEKK